MSVRTYNPSVRVGNWNEDLCLEEVRECSVLFMRAHGHECVIVGATKGLLGEERQRRAHGAEEN